MCVIEHCDVNDDNDMCDPLRAAGFFLKSVLHVFTFVDYWFAQQQQNVLIVEHHAKRFEL